VSRRRKISERLPPFVPLLITTLQSKAWRSMSHGARSLYIALRARFWPKAHNNGKIFLSVRDAAVEIGSSQEEICAWFKELQHYGFVVLMRSGHLGIEGKGRAPHWRLTELGYMHDPPTHDFLRWDGTTKFRRRQRPSRKEKSRSASAERGASEVLSTDATEVLSSNGSKCFGSAEHANGPDVRKC
jgi:hypothetical protein